MLKRLVLIVALLVGPAWADERNEDAAYKAMLDMTSITPADATSDYCRVKATVDFAAYTSKVGVFRDAFLNRDYSVDFYNQRRRQVFSYVVLKRLAELITEGLYNGHQQPECKFSITVKYPDKFGQERTFEALTWRFNNEQAAKVNWPKFDARDFMSVALDYALSSRIPEWTAEEPKLGDQGKREQSAPQPDCDMVLFNANAVFIRATAFCQKDYMDSREGLAALAGAKQCAGGMDQAGLKQKAGSAMLTLDRIAKERGRSAVCPFVEAVAGAVRERMH